MSICIFRDRLTQSPRHRTSPLPATQSLQAVSKTHAVQPILLPIPKQPEHPAQNRELTSYPGARSQVCAQEAKHPISLPVHAGHKHLPSQPVIPVVYPAQLFSMFPGNSRKAQQPPWHRSCPFRMSPEEAAAAWDGSGSGTQSPAAFPPWCACERSMHSPCSSPGPARAPASPAFPASQRAAAGHQVIKTPVNRFSSLPCVRPSKQAPELAGRRHGRG